MYRHKVVQGLADLIAKYGGGGKDPMMRAVWFGVKGQIPSLLQTLDNSEEAIKEIEDKLKEVLDIKDARGMEEELVSLFKRRNKDGSISLRIPANSKLSSLFPISAAEVEVVIEPAAEE